MKLVKALNGDYVNLENVDSLYVAPKPGGSWSVFARIGTLSFEMQNFFIKASNGTISFNLEAAAHRAMDKLAEELAGHSYSVNIDTSAYENPVEVINELLNVANLEAFKPDENILTVDEFKGIGDKPALKKRGRPRKVNPDDNNS